MPCPQINHATNSKTKFKFKYLKVLFFEIEIFKSLTFLFEIIHFKKNIQTYFYKIKLIISRALRLVANYSTTRAKPTPASEGETRCLLCSMLA